MQLFADFQSLSKKSLHDPLAISEVTDQLAAHDPLTISELADSVLSTKQITTQQLLQTADNRKEAARSSRTADVEERTSEMAVHDSLAEDPAEASEHTALRTTLLRTTQLAAVAPSATETQLAELESEINTVQATGDPDDADRTTLALHETQLQILQQMIATTQKAIEARKSKLFAKQVASELSIQLKARGQQAPRRHKLVPKPEAIPESLYTLPFTKETDEETQQLAEARPAQEAVTQELAMLSSGALAWNEPTLDDESATQELDMLRPKASEAHAHEDKLRAKTEDKEDKTEQILEDQAANKIVESIEHDVLAARPLAQLAAAAPAAPAITPKATAEVDPSKLPPAATPLVVTEQTQVNEDELAKRVADQLGPSIGATLTEQIMRHVQADIAKEEKDMESRIEDIAKDAASKSLAVARSKFRKTTTDVVHTPTSTTTTIVKGDANFVYKPDPLSITDADAAGSATTDTTTVESSGSVGGPTTTTITGAGAPVQIIAKPIHIDDESLGSFHDLPSLDVDHAEFEHSKVQQQIRAVAWEKHLIDERLEDEEKSLLLHA